MPRKEDVLGFTGAFSDFASELKKIAAERKLIEDYKQTLANPPMIQEQIPEKELYGQGKGVFQPGATRDTNQTDFPALFLQGMEKNPAMLPLLQAFAKSQEVKLQNASPFENTYDQYGGLRQGAMEKPVAGLKPVQPKSIGRVVGKDGYYYDAMLGEDGIPKYIKSNVPARERASGGSGGGMSETQKRMYINNIKTYSEQAINLGRIISDIDAKKFIPKGQVEPIDTSTPEGQEFRKKVEDDLASVQRAIRALQEEAGFKVTGTPQNADPLGIL